MQFLRPAMAALLFGVCAPALVAPSLAQTCVCPPAEGFSSGPVIEAEEPPPPLLEYDQPPMPAPGYLWTPGYWAWNNDDYYWAPGVWVEPPRPGLLWTPAYWAFVGGVYLFHRGYWAPHVGFYGGVDYGYGYNGVGYEGGRWENGRFFYNATVNNFDGVHVGNVYSQPVAVSPGVGRASYNGGPGGNLLKPTPEQERLSTEERIKPTPAQLNQVRAASVNPEQFHSANRGKPAIAATPRPGEFKGPGVVPAKAAGAAQAAPTPGPNAQPAPGAPPKAQEKLPAGEKPLGAGQTLPAEKPIKPKPLTAPRVEQKLPAGEKPLGGAAPGQPPAPVPLNGAAKPREKLPAGTSPNVVGKPPGAEKPIRPELAPIGAPKAMERPQVQPQSLQRPVVPGGMQRPPALERPVAPAGMAPGAPPRPELAPNGMPKGPPGAAAGKPPPPGGKPPLCGQPGLPPCPK